MQIGSVGADFPQGGRICLATDRKANPASVGREVGGKGVTGGRRKKAWRRPIGVRQVQVCPLDKHHLFSIRRPTARTAQDVAQPTGEPVGRGNAQNGASLVPVGAKLPTSSWE